MDDLLPTLDELPDDPTLMNADILELDPAAGEDLVPSNHDEFMAFMTFASNIGFGGCDCCDEGNCGPTSSSAATEDDNKSALSIPGMPVAIGNAVDEHLRKRKLQQLEGQPSVFDGSKRQYCIRQTRELVKREDGFSIWKLCLPPSYQIAGGDDPIVEYRSNHRILFVEKLNKASHIYSIGQGIIGSAAEEMKRKRLHLEEGSAYLLPCAKGIACGWINKPAILDAATDNEDEKKTISSTDVPDNATEDCSTKVSMPTSSTLPLSTEVADAIIYVLKVSPDTLEAVEKNENIENLTPWVRKAYDLFRLSLAKGQPSQNENDDTENNGKSDGGGELGGGIPSRIGLSQEVKLKGRDGLLTHTQPSNNGGIQNNNSDNGIGNIPIEGMVLSEEDSLTVDKIVELAQF